jgi:poly(A) polymerase
MKAKEYATDIIERLVNAGYTAYFAGGWVRDYLMGHPSDDIDIATDAPPEIILDLFPHTILVGLAFGVIIVVIDGHQFEVATFRRDIEYVDGRKPTQIELSTPEEDAARRDFTINGMFYDPLKDIILDFAGGREDLKHKVIRTIGDPYDRFFEDRLRMIRAVRFSARFGFPIDPETQEAVIANADTLFPAVAMERIWQELVKMSKYPGFDTALVEMYRLGLLPVIFPDLKGVHLNEIRSRVSHFADFPKGSATIFFLMELFPQATFKEVEELCRYLRTSVNEMQLAEVVVSSRQLAAKEEQGLLCDQVEWAHFYSHPQAWRCLQIIAARMPLSSRNDFLQKHRLRSEGLDKHIVRIIQKKPLVNAALLLANGIVPGKRMGVLLKQAERIAILHDLDDPHAVMDIMKSEQYL